MTPSAYGGEAARAAPTWQPAPIVVQNQHATSKHELLLSNGSDHMKYADEGSQRDSLMNSHIENMGAEDN